MQLTASADALKEYREAADWYRLRTQNASARFVNGVNATIDAIDAHPQLGSRPPGFHEPGIRWRRVDGFPHPPLNLFRRASC